MTPAWLYKIDSLGKGEHNKKPRKLKGYTEQVLELVVFSNCSKNILIKLLFRINLKSKK